MGENITMLFSVVVPVYNVKEYLGDCINSVLSQDFEDYEVVMVDDGSTDCSSDICEELKKIHGNIKVIHKSNGGLSDARNVGISHAEGKYIIFLDSDDYWNDTGFLKKMATLIEEHNPDVVVFGYKKVFEDNEIASYIPRSTSTRIEEVLVEGDYNICAWDKAVKKEILSSNQITFRKNVYSEDMEWCALLFKNAETAAVISDTPYSYRQRSGSITKRLTEKNISDVRDNYEKCKRIAEDMSFRKCEVFDFYLAKNISMFMIALSQLETKTRKKYYNFLKENLIYLKKSCRSREKIIYLVTKILGIPMTEYLLSHVFRVKNKNV